jgi:hypothetical protein
MTRWIIRLAGPALLDEVPRDHGETDAAVRRRRVVVAVTLVVGATLLGLSFATAPGDSAFYPLTLSGSSSARSSSETSSRCGRWWPRFSHTPDAATPDWSSS